MTQSGYLGMAKELLRTSHVISHLCRGSKPKTLFMGLSEGLKSHPYAFWITCAVTRPEQVMEITAAQAPMASCL